PARVKMPISLYDMWFLSRNGTDPMARPMGMPCKKYSSTRRLKFLWSCNGSSKKPWLLCVGVLGTGSSREKDSRDTRLSVRFEESSGAALRRISTLLFILTADDRPLGAPPLEDDP